VCNQFKAHVTESKKALANKVKMHLAVIPGGLTSQLQPLDVSVHQLFKGFMCEEWTKWIEAPTPHVKPAGRMKRPSVSDVCKWVKTPWQRVKIQNIVKYLKKCGISNALDGYEYDILYEKINASNENNHEADFSGSDNDFLGFYDE
jgi:hypothetical protein